MNSSFWQNRRVLVTGHTGFKGGWLALWLQRLGAQVVGYALEPATGGSLFTDARVAQGMDSVIGDLRDLSAVCRVVSHARPEIVFHLAAQPLVRVSYQEPVATFATNVMGTVNLMEALRRMGGVSALIVVSTDKVYENRELERGYREDDALGGYDPYAASKSCVELAVASYRRSFRDCPPMATARAGNVIGGGDRATDRLVPDILAAFTAGREPLIRSPQAVRPWQHVLEPLHGYMLLAEKLVTDSMAYASAWNFGPDEESHVMVQVLLERLAMLWGVPVSWKRELGEQPHETSCLHLDSTRARTQLGWRPVWTVDEALEQTVNWWREQSRGADLRAKTLSQIELFEHAVMGK